MTIAPEFSRESNYENLLFAIALTFGRCFAICDGGLCGWCEQLYKPRAALCIQNSVGNRFWVGRDGDKRGGPDGWAYQVSGEWAVLDVAVSTQQHKASGDRGASRSRFFCHGNSGFICGVYPEWAGGCRSERQRSFVEDFGESRRAWHIDQDFIDQSEDGFWRGRIHSFGRKGMANHGCGFTVRRHRGLPAVIRRVLRQIWHM